MINKNLYGILNPSQLESLVGRFNLEVETLEPVFTGWHKRIILSKNLVFLFPREPQFIDNVLKEHRAYRILSELNLKFIPKLIELVEDRNISSFPFIVTNKLSGIPLSQFMMKLTMSELINTFELIGESIGNVHNANIKREDTIRRSESFNYLNNQLETIRFLDQLYSNLSSINLDGIDMIISDEIKNIFNKVRSLEKVLIHTDIHEDQLLFNKSRTKVSAILDWESAAIDNPLVDFNFGEWGLEIWQYIENHSALRKAMFKSYSLTRNINNLVGNDLHVFYLVNEMSWMYAQKEKSTLPMTSLPFKESIQTHTNRLKVALS